MYILIRTVVALALVGGLVAAADEKTGQRQSPELAALQEQNAILEQRIKLLSQQQTLLRPAQPGPRAPEWVGAPIDTTTIESVRGAYTSLAGLAPEVAKDLACAGQNVVLYGPAQSQSLFELRSFTAQLETLRAVMKRIVESPAPAVPEQSGAAPVVPPVSAPMLQSVLDIVSMFRGGTATAQDVGLDDRGVVAMVAKAATAAGCLVYWPDQVVVNPFSPKSQLAASLQALADLDDNSGAAGKPAGLQQKAMVLRKELMRAETMSQLALTKVEKERAKLTEATTKADQLRAYLTLVSSHVKDVKDATVQDKLNKTFEKSWEELESAITRQLSTKLPGTIEDVGRASEMSKRLDVLKARTDFLSQYVADEKTIVLQDKLKRFLSPVWDQLDAAVKAEQALSLSVPKAVEPDLAESRKWERYAGEVNEHLRATIGASEAYATFRGALLDAGSGTSPLDRLLRAEALRDLTFDDKLQERPGSSIVQIKTQRLTGTRLSPPPTPNTKERDTFSGGVVLSFLQYTPNGQLKNSGVYTGYTPFK